MTSLARQHHRLSFERLHGQIRNLLSAARAQIWRTVNSTLVQAYWTIGRLIVEEEQGGSARAAYGRNGRRFAPQSLEVIVGFLHLSRAPLRNPGRKR